VLDVSSIEGLHYRLDMDNSGEFGEEEGGEDVFDEVERGRGGGRERISDWLYRECV